MIARACGVFFLVMLLATMSAAQPTSRPVGIYESQPILPADSSGSTQTSLQTTARSRDWIDVPRLTLSLAIVLGLIFALRWISKRYFPQLGSRGSASVVRVLSRSHITPKQQVVLMQVGRRVLVVADNGTQLSALSEIADPDEVAMLVGQVSSSKIAAGAEFGSAFGKAREGFEQGLSDHASSQEEADSADPQSDQARGEIAGLMDKVRSLAKEFGRR